MKLPTDIKSKLAAALVGGFVLVVLAMFAAHHLIEMGKNMAKAEYAEKLLAMQQSIARLEGGQATITGKIDSLAKSRASETRKHGAAVKGKVKDYVPPTTPDLPPGYRVLHDAAATGNPVPDAASVSHGAGVPVADATTTVIDNYTGCRENAIKVEGFQQWVREQRDLSLKSQQELSKILN